MMIELAKIVMNPDYTKMPLTEIFISSKVSISSRAFASAEFPGIFVCKI